MKKLFPRELVFLFFTSQSIISPDCILLFAILPLVIITARVFKNDVASVSKLWKNINHLPFPFPNYMGGTHEYGVNITSPGSIKVRKILNNIHHQWQGMIGTSSADSDFPGSIKNNAALLLIQRSF